MKLSHKFVEFVPEVLEKNVLYVSITYGTASHLCCCGCGREVVTPITPTGWKLTFDGETVSLNPSIGNWNFPCRSHYWISNNRVEWAENWTKHKAGLAAKPTSGAKKKSKRKRLWPRFWMRSPEIE
jgi:Family of unknown function (DUF6527)